MLEVRRILEIAEARYAVALGHIGARKIWYRYRDESRRT
jgi:hypothetical protein